MFETGTETNTQGEIGFLTKVKDNQEVNEFKHNPTKWLTQVLHNIGIQGALVYKTNTTCIPIKISKKNVIDYIHIYHDDTLELITPTYDQ